MGAYSPAPIVTEELLNKVIDRAVVPIINSFKKDGICYQGVIYAGVMIADGGFYVLEYNVRFGDPETQAILPRLNTDLVDVIEAAIDGQLFDVAFDWRDEACLSVVLASGGYPGKYETGKLISGLDKVKNMKDVIVFHAATKKDGGDFYTSGGRVLNVSALAPTIIQAQQKAYEAVRHISFDNMHYRRDIGFRAIEKMTRIMTNDKAQMTKQNNDK
jgi:phosphoribosylamine--glycine ligase